MLPTKDKLYQAYGSKERTKHRVANQTTRRQVKNLTIILTNKNQNVQTIVLVNMKLCVKSRRKMFEVVSIRMR